jgi:acetylornithine deacetylase/succinyl-diaminopimelate desuccinylase-like protein
MSVALRWMSLAVLAVCANAPVAAQPRQSARPAAPATARPLTRWDSTARDLLKTLIEINTTESSGSTLKAAEVMAARMKAAGFADSDVVVVPQPPRKGNLVVRLRGKNRNLKPMLLLSHLDVVEAKPEDWTLPPFQFIERDGTFFGRGVADDKDDGAIHLTILLRMRAEGVVPDRDIVAALTTDEEGGPENGVGFLLKTRPDLVQAEFVLNEGGAGSAREGRKLSNDVQASEKRVANFRLEVTNEGGHSSTPIKDNAITHLAEGLAKIGAFDFPVRLNAVTTAYFARSADIVGGPMGAAMKAVAASPRDEAAVRVLSADRRYNSQLRTTCVATMLDGGHAENALPQRARATVNCRILPEESTPDVQATLQRVVNDTAVKITVLRAAEPSDPSPLAPGLMAQIEKVTQEMWPGVVVIPTMSTGATDGRLLRNAGIPVYGLAGQFYGNANAHGMNERIPAQAFYESLEFMTRMVRQLSRAGGI